MHAESVEAVFARLKGYSVEEPLAENIRILVGTGLFIGEKNGKRVRLRRVKGIYFVERLESYRPKYDVIFEYEPSEDLLTPTYNDIILAYLAERLYLESDLEPLKIELKQRAEFLELTTKARIFDADRLFTILKEFRRNPESTLMQLKRAVSKAVIITDLSDIKYCPHCGKPLPTKTLTCPNCGFKFYSNIERRIKEL